MSEPENRFLARQKRRTAQLHQLALDRERIILDLMSDLRSSRAEHPVAAPFPSPYAPIEHRESVTGKGTTVAFSSLMLQNGLVGPEFANALSSGWGDVYFVKDFRRKWFQQGLSPLTDSRSETVSLLTELLRDAPRPLRFVGASAGGYAALYFGAHLQADSIVAVAPQTLVDRATYDRFQRGSPHDGVFIEDDPENDLASVLDSTPISGMAHIVFGDDHKIDGPQAERLSGAANVTLHPVVSTQHTLLARHVIKSGLLAELLST